MKHVVHRSTEERHKLTLSTATVVSHLQAAGVVPRTMKPRDCDISIDDDSLVIKWTERDVIEEVVP